MKRVAPGSADGGPGHNEGRPAEGQGRVRGGVAQIVGLSQGFLPALRLVVSVPSM